MRRTKGFTLIELLVVMAIIALLVSILAPSLTKILATARHGNCRANLDAIRKSMLAFASDNNDFFPNEGSRPTEILVNFALAMSLKGQLFVCPAMEDDEALDVRETNPELDRHGSYSYQAQYTAGQAGVNSDTGNSVVFIADRAPTGVTYNWGSGNQQDDAEDLGSSAMSAMSQNHDGGKFMMVASKGRTGQERRADVGDRRDNIFTLGANGPDQAGSSASYNTKISDRQVSCLLPIPTTINP